MEQINIDNLKNKVKEFLKKLPYWEISVSDYNFTAYGKKIDIVALRYDKIEYQNIIKQENDIVRHISYAHPQKKLETKILKKISELCKEI